MKPIVALLLTLTAGSLLAVVPEYTVENGVVRLKRVGPDNPILYDNDFWTDVPDAAYLWTKASLGEAKLVGNVITRCTFGWEKKYAHELKQQTEEAAKLLRFARASELKNIPEPVIGSTVAIRKPASGKVADTEFERTAGSALIITEAKKASPDKPLLVFVGGSCTTMASAFLADPSITNSVIVFQVDGGGYNGSDQWAWEITMRHFKFVNWARGYFWKEVSVWPESRFQELPKNALGDFLREYAASDLGKANQWGDGAWLFQLFAPGCVTAVEDYRQLGLTVPRSGTNAKAMADELFRTMHRLARASTYYELRLYTVTSNRIDAVLERFRDTVEPVRRKHGITTVGYWSAAGTTNGGTFAYLMAAASKEALQKQEKAFGADADFRNGYAASNKKHGKTVDQIVALPLVVDVTAKLDFIPSKSPRVFDLRIYSVLPGKLDAFRNRWRDYAVPIYERHGLHSLGWWVAEKKNADRQDQFVVLLAGESLDAMQKSIGDYHKDAEWQRVEKETERDGKLRSGVEAFKLRATDFSALK